jgi:hypothetical protein
MSIAVITRVVAPSIETSDKKTAAKKSMALRTVSTPDPFHGQTHRDLIALFHIYVHSNA